ncbi:MAG: hypothetical protein LBT94_05245 [Prevotellaceae bacterium]|jgi:hypothetical protein|nr:hypothetical protein [Prevotellaceae bacterium]
MAKRTFGKGNALAHLIDATEDMQKAQRDKVSEYPEEARRLSKGSIADLVRVNEQLKAREAQEDLGNSELQTKMQGQNLETPQASDKSGENDPVQGQHAEETEAANMVQTDGTEAANAIQADGTEAANAIQGAAVDKSAFFSFENVLSKEHKYKNVSSRINIAEDFYNFLQVISTQYNISITQVVNNMLRPYFADKNFKKEIVLSVQKKLRETINRMNALD